jgi:LuxR family maltose regulon positive regulatory protein
MQQRLPSLVLYSKLQTPQTRTKTLTRQRLISILTENLNKKLLFLCAGAGYGKTTLLSHFISCHPLSYMYYHLEKSDSEPAVFFSYLIAGLKEIAPEFGGKIESLSHFFNYPQRYLDIIVGTFINEVIAHIKGECYIILEDYHSLYPSEYIDRILMYMLDHMPANLHFIVTSRMTLPFSLSQLQSRDEILELDSQQLRFTKEEIRTLFEEVHNVTLKEPEVKWIAEHSEGWPTGLRLMLQSSEYLKGFRSSRYVKRMRESFYQSQTNVFNYFAQEIFNQESKETQRFLIDCSVVEWLTPDLCNAITRKKNSSVLLDDLTTRNVFMLRIPGVGYRFHNLFREFLKSKIHDIEREKRIHKRAADYFAKKASFEEAIRHYLHAENYTKAAKLIERIGSEFIAKGRSSILLSYIEHIPKSVRMQRPLLLMIYTQPLSNAGRSDEAKTVCLRAVKLLKGKKKLKRKYAEALYELGGIILNQGKLTTARRWFKKALDICPKSAYLTRASILNSIGSIYNVIGGKYLNRAADNFQRALKIVQRKGYRDLEASILNNWAMGEFGAGNLKGAYSKLMRMVNLLKRYFSPGCGAGFFNAARLSLLLGHTEEAQPILDAGMKVCSVYNDLWSMARLWQGYALAYMEFGDFQKAQQYNNKALEISERLGINYLIIKVLAEMADIHRLSADFAEADRNLATVWELKGSRNDAEAIPLVLAEARLRIAQSKFAEAEDLLTHAFKLAKHYKKTFFLFLINLELSTVYHAQTRTDEARAVLEKAVSMSRARDYDYLLLKELQKETWMIRMLRQADIQRRYIITLMRTPEVDVHWVDAYVFGTPTLSIDGAEIADQVWRTSKSKKLFFYLLLHKEERVSQDTLIDALWHDASYKSGSNSLRKAIQHIRQIFKSKASRKGEFIISSKGVYQIAPSVAVNLDTDEFRHLINDVKEIMAHDGNYEPTLKKLIALYKGGFANGWYEQWVEELRTYYRGQYEECIVMLVRFYLDKKSYKEALVWCKRLLQLNFYNEEYHRMMITTLAKVGRLNEAHEDYEKLKKALKKDLNTEPQKETTDLIEEVKT